MNKFEPGMLDPEFETAIRDRRIKITIANPNIGFRFRVSFVGFTNVEFNFQIQVRIRKSYTNIKNIRLQNANFGSHEYANLS